MLEKGNRVQLVELLTESPAAIVLGTVLKVSPAGYTLVEWDDTSSLEQTWFSPNSAAQSLKVVTGDDAIPVHDWQETDYNTDDWHCRCCKVVQTTANYWERCNAV